MCGIAGIFGEQFSPAELRAMLGAQRHRGPDWDAIWLDPSGQAGLAHNRLAIVDLSPAGRQPMADFEGRYRIAFNGEVYNYPELRRELTGYPFASATDTEVVLAAWRRWGAGCLDRFIGMFAFLLWDSRERRLFAVRDRFGVKPLYYSLWEGKLRLASEIRALHSGGVPAEPDSVAWATYLLSGLHDHSCRTFWRDVSAVPPGASLEWSGGELVTRTWYDLADRAGPEFDRRPEGEVTSEYVSLMEESVRLRFRSDVPVGVNLSGGLDSSILLAVTRRVQGPESEVTAFTYVTGDPRYDELPWVRRMLESTLHPVEVCRLEARRVPALAESVQAHQDEPFGGLPTLAYSRIFERAREMGVIVLLDGQGMDEQWAGYDYYRSLRHGPASGPVQGASQSPFRPECLVPEFRALAERLDPPRPFPDALRNRQYLDARFVKIPRALRFNDRVSMRSSTELREPFLDHRLVELAIRQPPERKIQGDSGKVLLRRMAASLLPGGVWQAPKRPLQTPQREWLGNELRGWARECIEMALTEYEGEWLQAAPLQEAWKEFLDGRCDSSFFVWQWISLGLMLQRRLAKTA